MWRKSYARAAIGRTGGPIVQDRRPVLRAPWTDVRKRRFAAVRPLAGRLMGRAVSVTPSAPIDPKNGPTYDMEEKTLAQASRMASVPMR